MTEHWATSKERRSYRRTASKPRRKKPEKLPKRWRTPLVAGSAALVAGALGWQFYSPDRWTSASADGSVTSEVPPAAAAKAVVTLPPPDLLRPLTPEEAAKENAERPFVARPDSPARKFMLATASSDGERALTCLTQAVYYEAAGEGVEGGRAVAQIVLNRLRHPGYPASVCGVIYQGAERPTGCQFTFTCDGSLLRQPAAALWARSRKIAQDALAGRVFAPVGHATHYHADYVLPYWADSLDKSTQIGRHIFYRLRGTYGEDRAFSQRYSGHEPSPPQKVETLIIPPAAVTDELATALISDNRPTRLNEVEKASPTPTSPLLADTRTGTLLIDGAPAPASTTKSKPKPTTDCTGLIEHRQMTAINPNDLRSGVGANRC